MNPLDDQPIDHFKKEAKRLAADTRTGAEAARGRVTAVYGNAASLGADVGLMRAQHVVAVESGFRDWNALVQAPSIELRLVVTMAKIPSLNDFGIGDFDNGRGLTRAEREAKFAKNRATLRASTTHVTRAVEWLLRNVAPTKMMSARGTSYGFKHTAEREIGYLTNGVFIAAGVIAGYPYKFVEGSPNVRFGFSARSLRELYERAELPERVLGRTTKLALSVLRRSGITDAVASTFSPEVVWREHDELRGMKFSSFSARPPLVAIDTDNFKPLIGTRTMRELGRADASRRTFAQVTLGGRGAQRLVVAYDEFERGIAWSLGRGEAFDRPLDVEPSTNDPAHGRVTWSRQARVMWSLQRRD